MGTSGVGGGGGSGGSGRGGGRGAGSVVFEDELVSKDPAEEKALAALQSVFSQLSTDYLKFTLSDAGVGAAYEALHRLHVLLVEGRSWDGVEKQFGVPGTKGCLRLLAGALCPEVGANAVHPRLRAPLQAALNDFFLHLVGNPVTRDSGDGAEVLKRLRPAVFKSTSARFLASYLATTLRQEESNMSRLALSRLAKFAEAKANIVVGSFESRFKGKTCGDVPQTSYSHLFRVIRHETDWICAQLRKTT